MSLHRDGGLQPSQKEASTILLDRALQSSSSSTKEAIAETLHLFKMPLSSKVVKVWVPATSKFSQVRKKLSLSHKCLTIFIGNANSMIISMCKLVCQSVFITPKYHLIMVTTHVPQSHLLICVGRLSTITRIVCSMEDSTKELFEWFGLVSKAVTGQRCSRLFLPNIDSSPPGDPFWLGQKPNSTTSDLQQHENILLEM